MLHSLNRIVWYRYFFVKTIWYIWFCYFLSLCRGVVVARFVQYLFSLWIWQHSDGLFITRWEFNNIISLLLNPFGLGLFTTRSLSLRHWRKTCSGRRSHSGYPRGSRGTSRIRILGTIYLMECFSLKIGIHSSALVGRK
jgi:hypothetical protein